MLYATRIDFKNGDVERNDGAMWKASPAVEAGVCVRAVLVLVSHVARRSHLLFIKRMKDGHQDTGTNRGE